MKLGKFDIDKNLSITQIKQVMAGYVSTSYENNLVLTNVELDSDRVAEFKDARKLLYGL